MERVVKFYTEDLALRACATVTTELVRTVTELQNASPIATMALGRLITAAVLMASQQKQGQKVGIRVLGDGPLGELFVDASYEGKARGYCQNPQATLPLKQGKVDVAGGVGKGTLAVTHAMPFQKQPHQGIVPLVSGEIGLDLAYYLKQSQQTNSVIALTVSLDSEGLVSAAGGVLLELLPDAPESVIQAVEKKLAEGPLLSDLLSSKKAEIEMAKAFIHDSKLVSVEHPHPIEFFCPCTVERVERTLLLLGRAALAEMALKGEPVIVQCEFCRRQYPVEPARLRGLLPQVSNS